MSHVRLYSPASWNGMPHPFSHLARTSVRIIMAKAMVERSLKTRQTVFTLIARYQT
ncbi:hypothetical protein SAMN05216308_103221 [Nitrosospira sp. Nsp13]|nr:hypothetical protein SAMN05216308_103221 [Nitrosospira sp. Nsp13]